MAKSKSAKARKERQKVSARKRAEDHKSGFSPTHLKIPDGMKMFKLSKPGKYRLDIMAYKAGEGNPNADEGATYFERTYFAHRNIGAEGNSYVCNKKTFGGKCPICEHRAKLAKDPDADEDLIKDLSPKERQLFLVRDVGPKSDAPDETQLWDISFHLFGKHLDAKIKNAEAEDEDEADYEYFADPVDGSTVKIVAEEKSFGGQTFCEVADIEFTTRKTPYDEDVVDEAPCLDDMLVQVDYDKLKKIFLETSDDDEDEEDEDKPKGKKKAPAKGKGKAPAKGKAKPKDDDEDEDDEEEEDEDEDDEEDDEDEDEDDEDEDEDDEDEKPAKGKAKAKSSDSDLEVGMTGSTKKIGDCEIVHISDDGKLLRLEDDDGEVHRGVKASEFVPDDEDADEDDEDEEDEKPAKGGKKKPAAKKAPAKKAPAKGKKKPADDDEDDDEDEDDEPAPKGKGKKKPAPKKKPDDDEWEDDDEDDSDEDEDDDE